jgi:hypothetical protein
MANKWNDKVKRTKRLLVYADQSIKSGVWASQFAASIREFNQLSKQHNLGVTLEASDSAPVPGRGGADVSIATANGQLKFEYDGVRQQHAFDGTSMHGKTKQILRDDGMEKAYVFVPAQPMILTPNGRRPVGPGVMKLIAVHEFVHACGLVDAEHTMEDLFQASPQVDYHSDPSRDRVMGKRGDQTVWMPPLFLSSTTARRIKEVWG